MWNRIKNSLLAKKKVILGVILAAILAATGITMSQQEQDKIVDTGAGMLPDAPATTTP